MGGLPSDFLNIQDHPSRPTARPWDRKEAARSGGGDGDEGVPDGLAPPAEQRGGHAQLYHGTILMSQYQGQLVQAYYTSVQN
jgi:hypothetical protein